MSQFFADLLSQTVTITNRTDGTPDGYGVATKVAATPVSAAAFLEPIQETEQLVEAETYRTTWRLFLLPDAQIAATDLVADSNGVVYQVLEVLPFSNARSGLLHHIECRLERVQG